jgi:hypothetical protein
MNKMCKSSSKTNSVELMDSTEDGNGQENHCPVCGAEPGQSCSGYNPHDSKDPDTYEYGRLIHRGRYYNENL